MKIVIKCLIHEDERREKTRSRTSLQVYTVGSFSDLCACVYIMKCEKFGM